MAAIGLSADLQRGRWARAAVAELVSDLGSLHAPETVRDRLARALGDPDLTLVLDGARHLEAVDGRVVTVVRDEGQAVAALVHDPAVARDRQLLDAAVSVARLAAANLRLQHEVAASADEVAASRRRLVEAGIEQRRRLGVELRDGAERRLALVAERIQRIGADGAAAPELAEIAGALGRARDDLHRFAQGVHPRSLTDHGLATSLRDMVAAMPLPVRLDAPAERFRRDVEASAYFLCAEALANIVKHAHARTAAITVDAHDGQLKITIADDGIGGADAARGSGLSGLADRIRAVGGSLCVGSRAGAGTELEARIPL
jgi:signal transduction histidine kinase